MLINEESYAKLFYKNNHPKRHASTHFCWTRAELERRLLGIEEYLKAIIHVSIKYATCGAARDLMVSFAASSDCLPSKKRIEDKGVHCHTSRLGWIFPLVCRKWPRVIP